MKLKNFIIQLNKIARERGDDLVNFLKLCKKISLKYNGLVKLDTKYVKMR
jgi:hypothetical protein